MNNKMDNDLMTILRYIDSSYLPSHYKICVRMVEQYGKLHDIDVFGLAMLVDALEVKGGYDDFYG